MSLINRVAVANLSNSNGKGASDWRPRFGYEILNFRGQSSIVNLVNGGGKSTIAAAMIGLLSRDSKLLQFVRKHACPQSKGSWSHIQVELVMPEHGVSQDDFLISDGGDVPGETWVFGMCLHNEGDYNYYFYPGVLESLPPGQRAESHLVLANNVDFRNGLKRLPHSQWHPDSTLWKQRVSQHIPQEALENLAIFQKGGGADKDAALFNVKVPPGERFDEAFFYEILAPELLTDVLGTETEEGEERLEGMLLNHVRKAVRATHEVEAQADRVGKMQQASDLLTHATTAGSALNDTKVAYKSAVAEQALDVYVLETLVSESRVPGIPKTTLPKGIVGQVAAHLVMPVEGVRLESYTKPRVTDAGLAILLGMDIRVVNQLADRSGASGQKVSQAIDIPCDSLFLSRGARGPKASSYTLAQAEKTLQAASSFGAGLTLQTAKETLHDAVAWFENGGDTNPYRTQLCAMSVEHDSMLGDRLALEAEIKRLQEQRIELIEARNEVQANEAAYDDLLRSGLFTDVDLADLSTITARVERERQDIRGNRDAFFSRKLALQGLKPDWDLYQVNHGTRLPAESRIAHEALKAAAQKALIEHDERAQECTQSLERTRRDERSASDKLIRLTQERQRFTEWEISLQHYHSRFGMLSPIGLEKALRDKGRDLSKRKNDVAQELQKCRQGVTDIEAFYQHIPEKSPNEWLAWAESERASGAARQAKLGSDLHRLEGRLTKLDVDVVAPAAMAEDALEALDTAGVRYVPLHAFIFELHLEPARQRDVLGVFSALLFAPVTDNTEAMAAVALLQEKEIPVPVFLRSTLEEYCRNADLIAPNDLERQGLLAGQITRQVECLLDPGLVEREKKIVQEQIVALKEQLRILSSHLEPLAAEGSLSQCARLASAAVTADVQRHLPLLISSFEELQAQALETEESLADDNVAAIRAAVAFESAGGRTRLQTLLDDLSILNEEAAGLRKIILQLEDEIASLKDARPSLLQALESAYPEALVRLLASAERFLENDGPQFLATAGVQEAELKELMQRADKRAGYEQVFPRALKHAQYQQGVIGRDGFENKLKQNQKESEMALQRRESGNERIDALEKELPVWQEIVRGIDLAAHAVLLKYPKVRGIRIDSSDIQVTSKELDSHALWTVAESLAEAIRIGSIPEDITSRASVLVTAADQMNIDADLADLQRLRKVAETAGAEFHSAVSIAAKADGFTAAEQGVLQSVMHSQELGILDAFDRKYTEILVQAQDKLGLLTTTRDGASLHFSEDIARMIDEAMGNLKVLKDVAKTDPPGTISHFLLDVDTVDRGEIKRVVEQIVALVDKQERRLQEDREGGEAPSDDAYQKNLAIQIRKKIYRSLFKNPSIRFRNSSIRPGGRPDILGEENISTGQKNALLMMWQLRLATYRMELAARRGTTSTARRKMRMRSQTIMIVDGLFSNLSEPSLIKSVMTSLTSTRGQFQLIGLVHDPKYQNDFDLFPVLLTGHKIDDQNGKGSWIRFNEQNSDGNTLFAKLMRTAPRLAKND